LREQLVGQLLLALYRDGRAGDALAAYRAARHRWAAELGLDPSPQLAGLETAILRADPSIAAPIASPCGPLPSVATTGPPAADVAGPAVAHPPEPSAGAAAPHSSAGPEETSTAGGTRHLRVVLVDDHPAFRVGMRAVLETDPGFVVAGEAGDVTEALGAVAAATPDVVVMDLHLPGRSGVEATRLLRAAYPNLSIIVVTLSGADEDIVEALRAGAHGYILKSAGRDEILSAIRSVVRGTAAFSAEVAERLATLVQPPTGNQPQP
jgi:CheY-like chemotaxis protein